ncbi:MAG TPA: hypothetical protein VFZ11_14490 [Gemmatimonadaceae bacterium]
MTVFEAGSARRRRIAAAALGVFAVVAPLAACTPREPAAEARREPERAAAAEAATLRAIDDTTFVRLSAELSEPGGYFDTDNLVSNERSYLHALDPLRAIGVAGGAYVGVGPDQNFSYIAAVRPHVAYIIDIRRDNALQHLLYKALFTLSANRAEFLALLTGRAAPPDLARWDDAEIPAIVEWIDAAPPDSAALLDARRRVDSALAATAVPLDEEARRTITRIHEQFAADGLDLRFESHGRRAMPYYPTFRDLVLETDGEGRQSSYLAREEDFRFVREMQRRNLVIPVVGNLAGEHALAAIGRDAAARGLRISVLYASNVEFYLMREGSFERWARTVAALPRDSRSAIVRSYFPGFAAPPHPANVPGYRSTQRVQRIDDFVAGAERGGWSSYHALALEGER